MKKRTLAIILIIGIMFSLVSCQHNNNNNNNNGDAVNNDSDHTHRWNENPTNDYITCYDCGKPYFEIYDTAFEEVSLKLNNWTFYDYFDLIIENKISGVPSVKLVLKNPEKYVGWQIGPFLIRVKGRTAIYWFSDVLGIRTFGLSHGGGKDGKVTYFKYPFTSAIGLSQDHYTLPSEYDPTYKEGEVVDISFSVDLLYAK